jgi:predicted Zn finger-like uncharacterized protein
MFTICPKCALTLVVTAADLRVAQGYVRCGRCSSVFNALARLTDERQGAVAAGETDEPEEDTTAAAEPGPPAQTPAAARPGSDASDEAISEDALEFNPETTDVDAVFVDPPPNPQWTAAAGSFKAMIAGKQEPERGEPPDAQVDVEIDAAYLATMLRNEPPEPSRESTRSAAETPEPASSGGLPAPAAGAPQPSRGAPPVRENRPPSGASRPVTPAAQSTPAARHAVPHTRPPTEAAVRPPPAAARARTAAEPLRETPVRVPQPPAEESDELTLEEEPASASAAGDRDTPAILALLAPQRWRIGAALALLLLAAQVINHYRDELAATARFNRPVTALYSALGVQLAPHWDLHAYDVRASLDAAARAGLLTVRASVKNAASQPQPLPLLRVTLQDRFGNPIAARDVAPRFYVPRAMPASSFLSGGQRIDAEMAFVDPGANAVGFEIDACLPASGGGVACANDASTR